MDNKMRWVRYVVTAWVAVGALSAKASTDGTNSSSPLTVIGDYYGIRITPNLEHSQKPTLDREFSSFFRTSKDLSRSNAREFGQSKPDQIVAFRDYLQRLVHQGYLSQQESLGLLQSSLLGAVNGAAPPIRSTALEAMPTYSDKILPQYSISQPSRVSVSTTQKPRKVVTQPPSSHRHNQSQVVISLDASATGREIHVNDYHAASATLVGVTAGISGTTNNLYSDASIGVLAGEMDMFGGYEADLSGFGINLQGGAKAGHFDRRNFSGQEIGAGLDYTWSDVTVEGVGSSGGTTSASIHAAGGNGNIAYRYQFGSPIDYLFDDVSHSLGFYFPYQKSGNSTQYGRIGLGYSSDDLGISTYSISFGIGSASEIPSAPITY
jgi:hypothetical protein